MKVSVVSGTAFVAMAAAAAIPTPKSGTQAPAMSETSSIDSNHTLTRRRDKHKLCDWIVPVYCEIGTARMVESCYGKFEERDDCEDRIESEDEDLAKSIKKAKKKHKKYCKTEEGKRDPECP